MMPSFHDVFVFALYAFIFVAIFFVCYMVVSFVQYLARENKLFEQSIKKVGGWIARNFEIPALCISALLLITFFFMSVYTTVHSFIMNETLLVGALLGFPILIKRVTEMQEQTRISREQLHSSQFSDAYGKLWSSDLGTRMTAIDSLLRFAQAHPKEEYKKVMDVFCQFIKHPLPLEAGDQPDIHAILHTFKKSTQKMMGKELMKNTETIDLTGADLQEAELRNSDLRGVWLFRANLCRANVRTADLSGANLGEANLSGSFLIGANFSRTNFSLTIINGANFLGAKNLKKEQINRCVFLTNHPSHKQPPILPHGYSCHEMEIHEWENECERSFSNFEPGWGWGQMGGGVTLS